MRGERERGGFSRRISKNVRLRSFWSLLSSMFLRTASFFLSTGRLFLAGDVRDAIKFSPHIIRGSIVKFCEKKERGEAGERERGGGGKGMGYNL